MNRDAKIFVAGAGGMVGSAIVRRLLELGYSRIVGSYHSRQPDARIFRPVENEPQKTTLQLVQADLTDQATVNALFREEQPEYVFMAAAKVGGIFANDTYPAPFIYENLAIQTNVIHAAYGQQVRRLLFLGSSCIYPKQAPQPMAEEHLLTGLLEPTNEPYAIAKIAGIKMCEAYNRQYGTRFMAVMPTNLYGANDNFDLETSHVLPALIRKFHEAKRDGKPEVVIWGTGSPRREFLHVDDMADACVFIMNLDDRTASDHFFSYPRPCFVNLGCGKDHTIKELAEVIQGVVGFEGKLGFDASRPDGTPQKLLDVTRSSQLGWRATIGLQDGVRMTYRWFIDHVGEFGV
ncbi:GDP-L-fucose synthase [Desulfosarcina widdelii]|uniref:GDP-L-fucose synthase n=1 Tax=Desulfosarcina widdelii TaxID=947919 RepID=A0A5K7ZD37_9BACT|nr:GDP-L-fucose synthase [Desulfosarcina widdelii]BBO77633.1 GDP-L-fucose synthase [Desulfosarcina widdelii]